MAFTEDQRGYPRDSGNSADMGAFEVQDGSVQDIEPPTVPENLTAAIVGRGIELFWDASSDNTGVAHYEIFRNGSSFETVTETACTDVIFIQPGLSATLTYTVRACDAAGNCSEASDPASVTLTDPNTAPTVTVTEPAGQDTADESIPYYIRWSDNDPDDSAQISLYYDTDSTGNDGVLIVSGLEEDDETDEYAWNTAGVPAGNIMCTR